MKRPLLCSALLLSTALVAQAQWLPVPNTRNPDWTLADTKLGFRPSRPDSLPGRHDRMPIANPNRNGATPAMPNALARSIISSGNTRRYWDADRQLAYEWQSKNPRNIGPDSLVTVRQVATGATYTYRKRPQPAPGSMQFPAK